MGIGRILHTHKSFSHCWCERIIHKVRTVLQTYGFHHTLHTHFFFTDCQYQTSFSSSLYPISIYRFFSSLFSPSSKLRKNFTRDYQCGTRFLYWHIKPYVRIVQSFFVNTGIMVASYCVVMKASLAFIANLA